MNAESYLPPPSPKLQCWYALVSQLTTTLNWRGAGFSYVDVIVLVLKHEGLFCCFYRSRCLHFNRCCNIDPTQCSFTIAVSYDKILCCLVMVWKGASHMQAVVMPYRCVCVCVCILCRVDAWYTETHDNLENLWKPGWKPLQNKRKPENLLIIKL